MQRAVVFVAVILIAVGVAAQQSEQESEEKYITHGEFAVLLLKVAAFQEEALEPEQALEKVKRLELVPLDWAPEDLLTHGEFSVVLIAMGVNYVPNDPDENASRAFVEAMLRRERWKLRDYLFAKGQGDGPIISPSQF